ncbi:MAG TPA: DNA-binding protein WhiA [Clostridia bacterium]|nr:DNA-binding protein WhiA [Clostridia bacterium]
MSFSLTAKNEIARIVPGKKCCQLAELAVLGGMNGRLETGNGQPLIVVSNENAAAARKIFKLCRNLFPSLLLQVSVTKKKRLKKNNVYHVFIPFQAGVAGVLDRLQLEFAEGKHLQWTDQLGGNKCCRRAYLRGAFLAGGSVSNPRGNYHLEIITREIAQARFFCSLMEDFGLQPRINQRKLKQVIYLKESDQIVHFLNLVGAHAALLSFENTRVVKDVRNQVNRLVNCETANLNKSVETGVRQVETIRYLQARLDLGKLPVSLREIARLRLEYPEASLKELGELLDPPVSKSGANHRLRRLEEIAANLERKGRSI